MLNLGPGRNLFDYLMDLVPEGICITTVLDVVACCRQFTFALVTEALATVGIDNIIKRINILNICLPLDQLINHIKSG